MAKKNSEGPVAKNYKKIMSDLKIFEMATIQMGGRGIHVTRVPGGYLYNDQFVYMSDEIIEDLKP